MLRALVANLKSLGDLSDNGKRLLVISAMDGALDRGESTIVGSGNITHRLRALSRQHRRANEDGTVDYSVKGLR